MLAVIVGTLRDRPAMPLPALYWLQYILLYFRLYWAVNSDSKLFSENFKFVVDLADIILILYCNG